LSNYAQRQSHTAYSVAHEYFDGKTSPAFDGQHSLDGLNGEVCPVDPADHWSIDTPNPTWMQLLADSFSHTLEGLVKHFSSRGTSIGVIKGFVVRLVI
jgi:hypothetical protein